MSPHRSSRQGVIAWQTVSPSHATSPAAQAEEGWTARHPSASSKVNPGAHPSGGTPAQVPSAARAPSLHEPAIGTVVEFGALSEQAAALPKTSAERASPSLQVGDIE